MFTMDQLDILIDNMNIYSSNTMSTKKSNYQIYSENKSQLRNQGKTEPKRKIIQMGE